MGKEDTIRRETGSGRREKGDGVKRGTLEAVISLRDAFSPLPVSRLPLPDVLAFGLCSV
jgi:hypothetical protein